MDEDVILREIVKSLAFEIEAVNQDNVLKWSTMNGTPLNVKVRVRNKDEPRLVQRGTMPVPRIAISAPEKLTLVSSNQTILSFSVYLQDKFEKKEEHKRQSGFKLFNIGSCLGTYSDDEGPYLPSSSNQNDIENNISTTSSSGILQKNAVPRNKKMFFGKCKPGGCLDPPFGEDNYSYGLSKIERHENIRLELNELEGTNKTCTPGGCLDSSFSEEKYPYSVPKTDHQKKCGLKLDKTTDNHFESRVKTMERSRQPDTFVQKITKDESDPKKRTDIYARTSEENSLKLKYSNSIITYPTDKHFKEKVCDQIPNKKMIIKSNDDESLRKSYDYPESYFVPAKDVLRYKEEERRYGRRLSTDQLSRSSKVTANDVIDKPSFFKSIGQESKYLQHTKGPKDTVNDIDLAPKVTNHETFMHAHSSGFKEEYSNFVTNSRNVDVLRASSPVEKEISYLKLQQAIIASPDIRKSTTNESENLQDDMNNAAMQIKQDLPSTQSTNRETISNVSPKESKKKKTEYFQDDIDAVELLVRQETLLNRRTSQEAVSELSSKKTNMEMTENLDDGINIPKMQVREDKPSTPGTSREEETSNLKLQQAMIASPDIRKSTTNETENLQDDMNMAAVQIKQNLPSTQSTNRETISDFSPKESKKKKTEYFQDDIDAVELLVRQETLLNRRTSQEAVSELSSKKTNMEMTENPDDGINIPKMQVREDKPSTPGTSREEETSNLKLQQAMIASPDIRKSTTNETENLQDDMNMAAVQIKQNLPSTQSTNRETISDFSPKESKKKKTEYFQGDIDAVELLVRQETLLNRRTSQEAMSELSSKKTNMEMTENLDDGINIPKMQVREDKPSTPGTSREEEISNLKLQQTMIASPDIRKSTTNEIENLKDDMNMAAMQIKQDLPSTQSTNSENISDFSSKESKKKKTEYFQDDIDAVELLVRQQTLLNQRPSQEAMSELFSKKTNMEKTKILDDGINIPKMQVREDKPSTRGTSREAMSKLSQSNLSKKAPITGILDNKNARNQKLIEFEKQPMPALDRFINTDKQTPTNLNQQFKNNDVKLYDKKTEDALILATATTIAVVEKESLHAKDKPNGMPDSLIKDKYIASLSNPEDHQQAGNVSPNYISSTENFDFDKSSSSHSIDFKQELLSTGKTKGLLDTSRQDDKWLSAASNNIKQKNDLRNVKVISEPEGKKTSAIFQKKPFKTKPDSDIRNDDINKATPLKRNTFTIIGSDTSLQKNEEIEEMPDNITDMLLKTTDKTNILNDINKKSETKIHTNSASGTTQSIEQDCSKDMYTKITSTTKPISDEQTRVKEEHLDKDKKKSENIFITDFDKSFKTKNVSNPTNYQTEILDATPKNIIRSDSLPKQVLINEKPHSNISEDDESTLTVRKQLKKELLDANVQAEYTKNKEISTSHLQISDEKILPKTTFDRKPVLDVPSGDKIELVGEYDGLSSDSLQKATPENEQNAYSTVYDGQSDISTQNEKLDFASIESKESTTYDSGKHIIEMLQKTTKIKNDLISKTADDGNLVSIIDPTSDEVDCLGPNFKEIKNKMYKTSNTSIQKLIPETALDLHSETKLENIHHSRALLADHNKDVSSDLLYDTNAFLDTENNEPSKKFILPEHIRDLHSGMPRKINDLAELKGQIYIEQDSAQYRKSSANVLLTPEYVQDLHSGMTVQSRDKAEVKKQMYNEMASKKYSDSAKDDSLKNQLENEQDFRAPTVHDNEYFPSDRIYENTILDTQSIEPAEKIKPEHVRDLNLTMFDDGYNKTDVDDQINNEVATIKYSESAKDNSIIRSENIQDLHTHTAGHIKNITSDQIYDKTELLYTENNEPKHKVIPVSKRDFQSAMADKIELNDQIYNDQGKVIDNEQTTGDSPIRAHTGGENEYISSDQKYDETTLLDPDSNQPQDKIEKSDVYSSKFNEQIEFAQNLTDNIHGLREKSKKASKSNSPFSGYSGLISEALSNILENIEGEEKQSTGIKVDERINSNLEDLACSYTKSYRDQEMLASDSANIVKDPGLTNLSHVIDDGSYNVPQNSSAKSFTWEESYGNIHKETIAQTLFIGHSSDRLRQRSDDYPNNTLNIARDDVLLDNTIDISKQNSEYQSFKILASINDSVGLNEDGFPLTHAPTLAKQKDKKSIEREADTTYLDMSFYSYMNNNNQRVVETHSPLVDQHRPHDGTVTVVKTLIRHGNEIRIPVDKENDISLNILDKDVRISNKGGIIGSPLRQTRRDKHVVDLAKRHDEVINKNLSLIYEHELIPLHNVIKNLAQEVNTLSAQQESLQMRIRNAKRTKSLRLIPVVKRCGCRRM